jgi:phosphoglycolate phosphatase
MKNGVLTLFDIDGTLVNGARCHYKAFIEAIKEVYNFSGDMRGINYAGKTDQQILREVLEMNIPNESIIKKKFSECLEIMSSYYTENVHKENIQVLTGVKDVLTELKKMGVLLGLVTGNLKPIAHAKLNRANLDSYFTFGGYGSDHPNRTCLVKKALKIAQDDFNFHGDQVFIIGDTPRDIIAGREAGVNTVAVATGHYSKDELINYDADFVLENLKNKSELLKIICNF